MKNQFILNFKRLKATRFLAVLLSFCVLSSLISITAYADSAPTIQSVSVPSPDTYVRGDTLSFTVVFDESVTVDTTNGIPTLELRVDTESGSDGTDKEQSVYALYESGSGTTNLVFTYSAISGLVDFNGIIIYALSLNNSTIKSSGGTDADITLNGLPDTSSVLVSAPLALSGGNGTNGTPYLIKTVADIEELAEAANSYNSYTSSYFELSNDIDFDGQSIATNEGGIPYFDGYFDGNYFSINNLKIGVTQDNSGNFGLFSCIKVNGEVKKLNVKNVSYTVDCKGTLTVGGIAGINNGKIDSCFASGSIKATNSRISGASTYSKAGGIAGEQNATGYITKCTADTAVSSTCYDYFAMAGGIVGVNNSASISNCGAYGTVRADTKTYNSADAFVYVGGFVGENFSGTYENCYSTADVFGQSEDYYVCAGGFVGISESGTISNSYATGNVTGETLSSMPPLAGGFAGWNKAGISQSYASGNVTTIIDTENCTSEFNGGFVGHNQGVISNSFSAGTITSEASAMSGGFAGYQKSSITNCYYSSTNTTGVGTISEDATATTEATGKSVSELKSYALISGTDSGNGLDWTNSYPVYNTGYLWRAVDGATFPVFQNQAYFTTPTATDVVNESGKINVTVSGHWNDFNIEPVSAVYIGYRPSSSTNYSYVSASLQNGTDYSATIENLDKLTDYVFCIVGQCYGQSAETALTTKDAVVHTITASLTGAGSVSPSSPISAADGFDREVTVTADSGQNIESLSIDSVDQTDAKGKSTYSYTFTNVTADHVIEVTFVAAPVYDGWTPPQDPVDKAMDNGTETEEGKLLGSIEVNNRNYQGDYRQDIPAHYFEDENKLLEVVTPIATVVLPDNMFIETPSQQVRLSVEEVAKDALPKGVRDEIGDKPVINIYFTVGGQKIEWSNNDVEVDIVIPYEPTEDEINNTNKIIAVYIDDEGNITPLTMSHYDSKSGGVVLRVNHFSNYAVQYTGSNFKDLGGYEWAKTAVETLSARGIINGTSEMEFAPQENISRADLAVLIVRFFGLDSEFAENFSDVEPGTYYYESVGIAAENGILTGIGDHQFCPSEPVSRQDMMVIINRALKATGQNSKLTAKNETAITSFSDSSLVQDYAKESVEHLIQAGIVNGDGENINPTGSTTRAEAAVILYRLLDSLNQ